MLPVLLPLLHLPADDVSVVTIIEKRLPPSFLTTSRGVSVETGVAVTEGDVRRFAAPQQ